MGRVPTHRPMEDGASPYRSTGGGAPFREENAFISRKALRPGTDGRPLLSRAVDRVHGTWRCHPEVGAARRTPIRSQPWPRYHRRGEAAAYAKSLVVLPAPLRASHSTPISFVASRLPGGRPMVRSRRSLARASPPRPLSLGLEGGRVRLPLLERRGGGRGGMNDGILPLSLSEVKCGLILILQ